MANEKVIIEIDLKLPSGEIAKTTGEITKGFSKAGKKSGRAFSKGLGKTLKNSLRSVFNLKTAVLGLGTALVGAFASKQIIDAAKRQEDAVNSLNSALIATGKYTTKTSTSLQEYAASLQSVTRYGDEAILETESLIQSLGNLSEKGLKGATQATLDMAAALKIDLRSAAVLVGKAAAGEIGSFSRYGVMIKKGSDNAETFANTLDALRAKFGGAAQRDVKTFSGATAQLSNTFGDLQEDLGFIVTKAPLVLGAVKAIEEKFAGLRNSLKSVSPDKLIRDVAASMISVGHAIVSGIMMPIEIAGKVIVSFFSAINTGVAALVAGIGQALRPISSVAEKLGFDSMAQGIDNFTASSLETLKENAASTGESLDSLFGETRSERINSFLDGIATKIEETDNRKIVSLEKLTKKKISAEKVDSTLKKRMAATSKQLAATFKASLVSGISGGIQNIVNSIAAGENAFKNFGKFVINIMGDMAIQMGQVLIGAGIGIESLKAFGGAAAIAAGAGLVAVGAIMKSFAGGGGSSTPVGAAGSVGYDETVGGSMAETEQIQEEPAEPATNIVLNVDTILDGDESGLRIVELINRATDANNVTIRRAAIA